MLRPILLAALLCLTALVPPASAEDPFAQTCLVRLWTQGVSAECEGVLYEAATVTWCPRHPLITCINQPLLACGFSTTWRPFLTCPPLA